MMQQHHSLYGGCSSLSPSSLTASHDPLMQAAAMLSSSSSSSNRDTTFTKIFVGGLPYHTTDQTLHDYFEQYGDIEEAVVITDRQTQKSRGYGFVTMKDRTAADRACKDPNPIIDGRKANVNLAYLGAKPRGNLHLTALSSGLQQLPLQTQLQALFPSRLGLQQLYYPTTTASQLVNAAAAVNNPALMGIASLANHNASSATFNSSAGYYDYATLAAAHNATFAMHPAVIAAAAAAAASANNGYDAYAAAAAAYGSAGNYAAAAQLAAAQSQIAAANQQQQQPDNQHGTIQ